MGDSGATQAPPPHAVARLRAQRLAHSSKPFLARGGAKGARCAGCRLRPSHCLCAWRPALPTHAGVCLLMADTEPLKPSNTGWLVADMVADTFAFGWQRTATDPGLAALLQQPQWQACVVFPQEYADAARVVHGVAPPDAGAGADAGKRPLFILLDGTWAEARKMFRKTPSLDQLPVLHLGPDQPSRYSLRRARRGDHFCTSEVAALCLDLAGEHLAAATLNAYLDVFSHHYLQARNQRPVDPASAAHRRLQALCGTAAAGAAAAGAARRHPPGT
jgi:DTW domain-containing protein YfiP